MRLPTVLAVLALLILPASAAAALPSEYVLPGAGVFPEGITTRAGSDQFFVSSTGDGTVFRGRLGQRTAQRFLAPGKHGRTTAVGLRATRKRLVVAGGGTGLIFVYDLPRGRLVRRLSTGAGGFINDVAITPAGDAYATDSARGHVFRIPARLLAVSSTKTKSLAPFVSLASTPVGSFANGIVPAGRRHLLVVGLQTGVLGRIDTKTRAVRVVSLAPGSLVAGDGLALAGRTLYAVSAASRVTEIRLSADWLTGTVRRQITSPSFRFPTTVAVVGRRLLVVNSQFDKRGPPPAPVLPFTVSAVPRP